MSMFLAVVALFVAFGALWFTSEIARRLDLRGHISLNSNGLPTQDTLLRAERQIRDLSLGLKTAEQKIQSLNARGTILQDEMNGADIEEKSPVGPLNTLDILRDARRFYPSETYKS